MIDLHPKETRILFDSFCFKYYSFSQQKLCLTTRTFTLAEEGYFSTQTSHVDVQFPNPILGHTINDVLDLKKARSFSNGSNIQ